ncbi:MAG TPA: CHAP domain-containing protein [Solirubrobacterales bacterium]|nr:CHAP domain-containing protein [Solirubrobacterales bacterium]
MLDGYRSLKNLVRQLSLALGICLALLSTVAAGRIDQAAARASRSMHPTPSSRVAGVTRLCGPAANYRCTAGGYAGKSQGWPGLRYGSGYASRNTYGLHNCTLYAAYRLWKNGLGDPGWHGNANSWDTLAPSSKVNQSPALGAIAQWNRNFGHVAYVDKVTSTYIEVTDDNYGYNYTDRWRIARNSAAMPDNFIHLRDQKSPAKPKPKAPPKSSGPAPPSRGDSTGVYFPWDQSWHLSNALAAGASNYAFVRGQPNSIPVVGDWDGDGKDSTGVYFPWDQSWHLRNELNPGPSEYAFVRGQPNSIPVVGDWNGDGKDSTGVFFPWDNSWHLRNELNPGPSEYAFVRGQPNSIPVVGDWDGDGKDSTGVYFPWDQSWHLSNALAAGASNYAFVRGQPNSIPVVGDWDGQ